MIAPDIFERQSAQSFGEIEVQEMVIKKEIAIASAKEVRLRLNRASFFVRNFVCNVCCNFFSSAHILKCHKRMHDASLTFDEVAFPCDQSSHLYEKFDASTFASDSQVSHIIYMLI
jgi:hypothetical protein